MNAAKHPVGAVAVLLAIFGAIPPVVPLWLVVARAVGHA